MITVDTSALVRFFTNDISSKAKKTKELIDNKKLKIKIPDVVLAELEYVLLGNTYKSNREDVLKAYKFLMAQKNISVSDQALKAMSIYETTKLDFADCIIAASSMDGKLFSFDKDLKKVKGVKSVRN